MSERTKLVNEIFDALNRSRAWSCETFTVHFRKWQWYVNNKPVTNHQMRDAVFAYVESIHPFDPKVFALIQRRP
jgi:hypothetical protein